jgi:hypothetical protein
MDCRSRVPSRASHDHIRYLLNRIVLILHLLSMPGCCSLIHGAATSIAATDNLLFVSLVQWRGGHEVRGEPLFLGQSLAVVFEALEDHFVALAFPLAEHPMEDDLLLEVTLLGDLDSP